MYIQTHCKYGHMLQVHVAAPGVEGVAGVVVAGPGRKNWLFTGWMKRRERSQTS